MDMEIYFNQPVPASKVGNAVIKYWAGGKEVSITAEEESESGNKAQYAIHMDSSVTGAAVADISTEVDDTAVRAVFAILNEDTIEGLE